MSTENLIFFKNFFPAAAAPPKNPAKRRHTADHCCGASSEAVCGAVSVCGW